MNQIEKQILKGLRYLIEVETSTENGAEMFKKFWLKETIDLLNPTKDKEAVEDLKLEEKRE